MNRAVGHVLKKKLTCGAHGQLLSKPHLALSLSLVSICHLKDRTVPQAGSRDRPWRGVRWWCIYSGVMEHFLVARETRVLINKKNVPELYWPDLVHTLSSLAW